MFLKSRHTRKFITLLWQKYCNYFSLNIFASPNTMGFELNFNISISIEHFVYLFSCALTKKASQTNNYRIMFTLEHKFNLHRNLIDICYHTIINLYLSLCVCKPNKLLCNAKHFGTNLFI